jgi:hypothetical protein
LESNNGRKNKALDADHNSFELLRRLAVLRFLRLVQADHRSRVASSEVIASVVFGKEGFSYRARSIRDWADDFCVHLELPSLRQGKFQNQIIN